MNSGQFITDIVVVSGKDKCLPGYTILTTTFSGNHDANLYEGSFLKGGGRYLCFAKIQNSPTMVTDITIVKEKDSIPTGFTAIKTCANDASEKSFRKHVLCLKTESNQKAATGVVNIVAVQQSKGEKILGNFYTISNDVNGINISYQTIPNGIVRRPPPYNSAMTYRPPNVHQGYPGASQALPYSSPGHHMPVPVSLQGTAPTTQNQPSSPVNKQTSAIQGVLFQVNPKFELLWKKANVSEQIRGNRCPGDIEKKYRYTFETEQNILSSR
ncbi:Multivesicular body subunit 12B [Paramuricea clavata]|uniref:Multivesicular body subunit 12B n=1 Tax=Paramuricea clavata TaxID=317549 RepID=A0A7D9DQ72_PARCT|nr:Multivesicular body subunit 12B [Paramuricea clavata]